MSRSTTELAERLRAGRPLAQQELEALDRAALAERDVGTWLFLRAGGDADALAAKVITELADVPADEIIAGACALGETLRHVSWHVLAKLAEERPQAIASIEAAIANWRPRNRPWMNAWLADAEAGFARPWHRLARNLGMQEQELSAARIRALGPSVFATLRELDLRRASLDSDALEALVTSPHLAGLEVLSLEGVLQEQEAGILGPARLPALRELWLRTNTLLAEELAALLVSPALPRLSRVDAAGCGIDLYDFWRELRAVVPAGFSRPVALDLSQSRNVAQGLIALSADPGLGAIAGLDLHHVDVTVEGARALAVSPHAGSLRRFSINTGTLGESGVRALLEAPWMRGVQELNLFNQRAGDAIAPALERLGGGAIEVLELMHENLGIESCRALGRAELGRLRELRLSHNPLGDEGVAAILANPTLTSLEVFEASDCGLGEHTARAVSRSKALRNLRVLQLGEKPADEIVAAFASVTLPSLRRLQLVRASNESVARLAEAPAFTKCFVTNQWHSDYEAAFGG